MNKSCGLDPNTMPTLSNNSNVVLLIPRRRSRRLSPQFSSYHPTWLLPVIPVVA
jgi:hypothetical protein